MWPAIGVAAAAFQAAGAYECASRWDAPGAADSVQWVPDLDGDASPELLVQEGRRLMVYRPARGRVSPTPAETIDLAADVFAWTLGRLRGTTGRSLLLLTSGGVHALVRTPQGFAAERTDLLVHPTVFRGETTPRRAPPEIPFAPELFGDGPSAILFFTRDEPYLFRQAQGVPELVQKLRAPPAAQLDLPWWPNPSLYERTFLPHLSTGDVNADGLTDLFLFDGQKLRVFRQRPGGGFLSEPDEDVPFERRRRQRTFLRLQPAPILADIDGDGTTDLIYVDVKRAVIEIRRALEGTLANARGEPRRITDAWGISALFVRPPGAGRPWVLFSTVAQFGVAEAFDILRAQRIDMNLFVFPVGPNGTLEAQASRRITVTVPFRARLTQENEAQIDPLFLPMTADVNGDRLPDVIVWSNGSLVAHHSDLQGQVSIGGRTLLRTADVAGVASLGIYPVELNGDGRSDFLLHYVRDFAAHGLEIWLSR